MQVWLQRQWLAVLASLPALMQYISSSPVEWSVSYVCQNPSLTAVDSPPVCAGFSSNHCSHGQSDIPVLHGGGPTLAAFASCCACHDRLRCSCCHITQISVNTHTAGRCQSGGRGYADWCTTPLLQCLPDIRFSHGKACTRKGC